MTLPGKLCVGILEEDNPLKSYFRFKPLLVAEEGGYLPFDGAEAFPENGCLRIVPDKNESGHFKARMRRIGRYALLDLRAHPGENDKIRPNKNYRVDSAETNAYIVYSDVVVEPPAGMLFEVLDRAAPEDSSHMALTMPLPGTPRVLFRDENGGVAPALWRAAAMEGVEGAVELSREEERILPGLGGETRLPGFAGEQTCVMLAAPGALLTRAAEATEGAEVTEAHAPVVARPVEVRPVEAPTPIEARPVEAPAPVAAGPAEAPSPRPERPGRAEAPREREKPRLSARAQAMALQTGLNPRRSRSLQEIIDDRWRRSRFDQLGHPVPGEATGMPVESPVERAMDALRAAWRIEETRPKLAEAIGELEGMSGAIQKGAARREDEARTQRLNELEAQRLRLLNEVSALEARRADARERLLEDVRRDNARQLAEGERRLEALKADIAACEERAQGARAALAEAESAYAEAEKRLAARAMETKALRFLQTPAERVPTDSALPSAGELISDVRTYLERAGVPLSHDQAVELLAALTLSPVTVLCGPALAPKGELARALAGALGLGNRFLCLSDPRHYEVRNAQLRALLEDKNDPAPAMILLESCNEIARVPFVSSIMWQLEPLSRPLCPARLLLTASDEGSPLATELLDTAFVLWLEPESADTPWHEEREAPVEPELAVSRAALENIFRPHAEAVTEEVRERMARLRADLAAHGVRLSRRTLDAVWLFCAAAAPLLRERSPMQALDLALAHRALPALLSSTPLEALEAMPEMVTDLEECKKLLERPLPIFPTLL